MKPIPCTQCGTCCRTELCQLAINIIAAGRDFDDCYDELNPPCPFLVLKDGKHWCGVIIVAEMFNKEYAERLKFMLGIGLGCCDKDRSTVEWDKNTGNDPSETPVLPRHVNGEGLSG